MYTVRGFLKAAARGDSETVGDYLRRHDARQYLAAKNSEGNTALHLAATGGFAETINLLLDVGGDIKAINNQGVTPLASAVMSNAVNSVPPLIAAGADVNAVPSQWGSLLAIAAGRYGGSEIAGMLLDAKADVSRGAPLITALEHESFALAERLLKAGADPEAVGSSRSRPIHYAAQNGQTGVMAALLERGADMETKDYYGNTPLHVAISHGHPQIVRMLVDKGARIDVQNSHSVDAYAQAQQSRRPEMLEIIEPLAKEALAKRTTPLNATADVMPAGDAEIWVRMGAQKVARVGVYPALGRRLTEIFNFESRERLIISENLKTQAENLTPPQSFDEMPEPLLRKALEAFRAQGGQADDETVFATRLHKNTLKPGSP